MWQTVTEADVLTKISGDELTNFRAAALAPAQVDPLAEVIENAVRMVRSYVVACRNNRLNAGSTVPHALVGVTVDLVVPQMMTRAAGIILDPDGVRRKAADEAMRILRDCAACRFMVERPQTPDTEQIGYQSPSFHGRHEKFKHENGI